MLIPSEVIVRSVVALFALMVTLSEPLEHRTCAWPEADWILFLYPEFAINDCT